jgi:hypothetical protein
LRGIAGTCSGNAASIWWAEGNPQVKILVYLRWGTQWNVHVPQSYLCLQMSHVLEVLLLWNMCVPRWGTQRNIMVPRDVRGGTRMFQHRYAKKHACFHAYIPFRICLFTKDLYHLNSAFIH